MNFQETDVDTLIFESKSKATRAKTDSDVKYFKDFLVQIRGGDEELEQLDEKVLASYLCDFFGGIKKRKDGSEYEPSSLWGMFGSIKKLKDT